MKILAGLALTSLALTTFPFSLTSKFSTIDPSIPLIAASGGHLGAILTSGINWLVPEPKFEISPRKAP